MRLTGSWPMPLLLVHPSVDLTLELYVSSALEEAIAIQWERIRKRTVRETYVKALEYRLQELLTDCLDWDLKPPTDAQVSFATLLAARHGISVPSEALSYRFHTAMFIETWSRRPAASSHGGIRPGSPPGVVSRKDGLEQAEPSSAQPDPFAPKDP
jgi:hypothetical protein